MSVKNFSSGIRLAPHLGTPIASLGGTIEAISTDGKAYYYNASAAYSSPFLTEQHSASISNKIIDANSNSIINLSDGNITSLSRSKLDPGGANQVVLNDSSGNLTGLNLGANGTVFGITGGSAAFFVPPSAAGITSLVGDVTATGPGSVSASVKFVGSFSASQVVTAVTNVNAASSSGTANTLVKYDSNGSIAVADHITIGSYKLRVGEFDNGSTSASMTIFMNAGAAQKLTITQNCTLVMASPQTGAAYVLNLINDGTHGIDWSTTAVIWLNSTNTAPAIGPSGAPVLINFYWNGSNYLGSFAQSY